MFILVDCNNFFASCEQIFNPQIRKRPVVILSNNDGCVIARSSKAKALGIPMGAPHFKWRDFFKNHDVVTLSSNFTLYGDISSRVVATLEEFGYPLEIYSIDESFLQVNAHEDLPLLGRSIHQKVKQWTGIPTSVGIAATKTLAKMANYLAKKESSYNHVCLLQDPGEIDAILLSLPVEEVWGIGRRLARQLNSYGIRTALQLKNCDDTWIRKKMSVIGLRTVWELRGISCLESAEEEESPRSILTSRSFSHPLTALEDLEAALTAFTSKAAEKLRRHELCAGHLAIFVMTDRFKRESYCSDSAAFLLPRRTLYTPELISYAKKGMQQIFTPGLAYKRAGVILSDLTSKKSDQLDLLAHKSEEERDKLECIMDTLDGINQRYGRGSLVSASQLLSTRWHPAPQHLSPKFTTSWDELPTITLRN